MSNKSKALKKLNKVSRKQKLRDQQAIGDDSEVLGFIIFGLIFIFIIYMIFF